MHAVVTDAEGVPHTLEGRDGDRVMILARAAGLPVKGECEASLACATCHMIVDPLWADRLDPPTEEEEAMLDTVFDLSATSRLSCQIRLRADLDGIRLSLPA
jgi:ferredoxin